ncbi:MAG: hypothetical protein PHN88_01765 [Ignavibacteria bacterium]|nr:hypothetical protein [Ignavibacteria bacterium]
MLKASIIYFPVTVRSLPGMPKARRGEGGFPPDRADRRKNLSRDCLEFPPDSADRRKNLSIILKIKL